MPDDASIAGFTIDILANTNINLRLLRSTYFFYYYTMNKIISTLLLCLMLCVSVHADVRTWKGAPSATFGVEYTKWDEPSNWEETAVPGAQDDVIIPAGCYSYPVLTAATQCKQIYFELYLMDGIATTNSARIGRQDLLTYEKAFCDITIRANRYVRITSPLQNTYTGDFFVEHQTLNKAAWAGTDESHFVPATYEAKVGNAFVAPTAEDPGVVNRAIRGTYYSFYSGNYEIVNQYNRYDVQKPISQWGNPVNGLVTPIKQAVSFDVWVNNGAKKSSSTQAEKDGEVTFHFPAGNTEYAYYDTDGNLSLRQPDRNINRAKSGKFWLDKATMSVPFTQEAPSSMFAVGNPGFAYLSISEFLARNTKNISPFVYTHTEKLNGRGSEIIYYYNIADSKLYRIKENYTKANPGDDDANPGIGDNPLTKDDSHPVAATSREGYLNPAEGFRVMGGSVGFSCDEPDLVGVFRNTTATNTSFTIAKEVREQYYTNLTADNGTKKYSTPSQDISMLKPASVGFDMSITTTDHSDEIRLNNFLNRGSVVAQIVKDPVEDGKGTLVIKAGQPIMAVFKGPESNWNGSSNKDADKWMYESGKTGDVSTTMSGTSYGTESFSANDRNTTITSSDVSLVNYTNKDLKYRTFKLYGTKDAWNANGATSTIGYGMSSPSFNNPSFSSKNIVSGISTCDIVFNYTIVNGTVTISLQDDIKMFIASDAYKAAGSTVKPAINEVVTGHNTRSVTDFVCEAWFAYEGATMTKKNLEAPNGETFIAEEVIGEYSTYVRENLGRITVKDAQGNDKPMIDHGEYSKIMPMSYQTSREDYQGTNVVGSDSDVKITLTNKTYIDNANYLSMASGATIKVEAADGLKITSVEILGYRYYTNYVRDWRAQGESSNLSKTGDNERNRTWTSNDGVEAVTISLRGNNESRILGINVEYVKNGVKGHVIEIKPVLGSYNTVGILGLYPEDTKTMVLGQISAKERVTNLEIEGYKYTGDLYRMLVPAGQLAHQNGSSMNPGLDHYFYSHGNSVDMVKMVDLVWCLGGTLKSGNSTIESNYYPKKWVMTTGSENNDCNEAMVARQGMQPYNGMEEYDGLILGELTSSGNIFFLTQTQQKAITGGEETPTITPGSGQAMGLTLNYSYPMFYANIPTAENPELRAPSRAASHVNAPTFITASTDDMASSAMVIVNDIFSEEYTQHEDAPLFDAASGSLIVATLAGTQLVGVNATSLVDMLPLYLSQTATVSFTNVASLGENAAIYDAVEDVTTLLVEGQEYELVVLDGQQAGRYFLVADAEAPSITTSVEEVETYSWKPVAYCPAEGALTVCCAEELSYEVYAVNGMLIGAAQAQSYTFSGLQSGTYIVRAIRGQEMQSLKVIVY